MKRLNRQSGAVLLVSLFMMIVLMLLAVSTINMSTVNLRIVDNMRSQMENDSRVSQAVEQVLSNVNNFRGGAAATAPINVVVDGEAIQIAQRRCVLAIQAPGYDLTQTMIPQDTTWDFTASYTDPTTGANTSLRQGVLIRMPAGNCNVVAPAP